jgi:hypothetical protein
MENDDGSGRRVALVFAGVEAFACTYYRARAAWMLEAYDRIIDCGRTSWLRDVSENLKDDTLRLQHLAINFDDGPCYEFVCTGFRMEEKGEAPKE